MNTPTRRAYEPGHRPKFMAVVDETAECSRAVRFAARRAARIGSGVLLVTVIPPVEISQWRGVEEVMEAEALELAERQLASAAAIVRAVAGLEPEKVIRHGNRADEILKVIAGDEDVALLILGAGTDSEGPGPLVSNLAGRSSGNFPVPLAIVPGHLSDQDIDALA